MAHIIFGEGSIRCVSKHCGTGAVVYQDRFRHSGWDLLRLPITIAGEVGDTLFTEALDRDRTSAEFAEDDRKEISKILSYNFLPANYFKQQEKRVVQCMKRAFVKAAIRDVADLLYEKLFRVAYVKKSINGKLVHATINNSLIASASRLGNKAENLSETARKLILPPAK